MLICFNQTVKSNFGSIFYAFVATLSKFSCPYIQLYQKRKPMTEDKWLNFAGFLTTCMHDLEHPECPFNQYRCLDQYQRLEFLMKISESEATKMMTECLCNQSECSPIHFVRQNETWGVAVAI